MLFFAVVGRALLVGAQRVGMRHGDDVVAAIDEMNFPGYAGREVGEQLKCGAAELVQADAAMERRMPLLKREHRPSVADAGASERADRAGRNGVDADALGPEIDGAVADPGL